jgi:hypothetical protein
MTALVIPRLIIGLGAAPENAVLVQLTQRGIPAGETNFVKLAPPVMADGLTATAQKEVLKRVAGRRPLEELTRDAVVSPFVLEISDAATRDEAHPFRRADVYFIAHGALEKFRSEKFLGELAQMLDAEKKGALPLVKGVLSEEERRARDLTQEDTKDVKERYGYSTFNLLDRVYLSATRRLMVTETAESVLVASITDPRFDKDRQHPNQWQSIAFDQLGKLTLGPPHPYHAAGFYLKVTQLAEPKGALFIEHHHAFEEPPGWFKGTGLLRSKIPLLAQDAIRKLRRKLREAPPEPGK